MFLIKLTLLKVFVDFFSGWKDWEPDGQVYICNIANWQSPIYKFKDTD